MFEEKQKSGPTKTRMQSQTDPLMLVRAHTHTRFLISFSIFVLVEPFRHLEEGCDFSQQCVEIMSNSARN